MIGPLSPIIGCVDDGGGGEWWRVLPHAVL